MKPIVLILGALVVMTSWAGPKEDFIAEVEKQCGIGADEAQGFATPGRTGNVVQFKLCLRPTLKLSGNCNLKCKKKSSNIGR